MEQDPRIVWLHSARQRLGVLPELGASVAAWQCRHGEQWQDLWRGWDGTSDDRYTLAAFAMLPWCNRISGGGFHYLDKRYAVEPNRLGESYPIHGDAWLRVWTVTSITSTTLELQVSAMPNASNPYSYVASQTFSLNDSGLDWSLRVTHRGDQPLPYGVGFHPWFWRDDDTRLTAPVGGVWLSGVDPIPVSETNTLPDDWNLTRGISTHGTLIDHCFKHWQGAMSIAWPKRRLALHLEADPLSTPTGPRPVDYCVVFRPIEGPSFCFEPVSHVIDAFNLPGRPGLVELNHGESIVMRLRWRVQVLG